MLHSVQAFFLELAFCVNFFCSFEGRLRGRLSDLYRDGGLSSVLYMLWNWNWLCVLFVFVVGLFVNLMEWQFQVFHCRVNWNHRNLC